LRKRVIGPVNHLGKVLDTTTIEIGKTEEDLDLTNTGWGSPGGDNSNFGRIHRNSLGRNDVTQELDLVDTELTLLEIDLEFSVGKKLQDSTDIGGVSLLVLRLD